MVDYATILFGFSIMKLIMMYQKFWLLWVTINDPQTESESKSIYHNDVYNLDCNS